MSQKILNTYIPLVVFPVLSALALKLTYGNVVEAGLLPIIDQNCPAQLTSLELTPHRLDYLGVPSVDQRICGFVSFFHLALTPEVLPFLTYFMASTMALLAIPAFESWRAGRHSILALPVLFGLMMQIMTVGAVLPLYWLIFILTGTAQRRGRGEDTKISAAHAQAVIFGLNLGAGIPSVCLLVLQDPHVTALWQLFPLWQFLAQSGHLLVRRPSADPGSGYSWIRALYIGAFIIASSTHVGTLARAETLEGIKAVFLPSVAPLTSAASNLKALDMLQWDAFFAYTSTLLGTVWFAEDARQAAGIILWNVIGSIMVGPGAAIAAVALWRESHLHPSARVEAKEKSK
ncbi:hypothetical protein DFH07DRAFT_897339 [Mycena maculata]|uniref:Uncharacterized protein n=1 Tax=Mycena maculata TaxID=230809 RepID=A0AAD7MMC6_9AGAR|nr:hypothetical protein DFH07DRAFT_897339 [Mycena maculata]